MKKIFKKIIFILLMVAVILSILIVTGAWGKKKGVAQMLQRLSYMQMLSSLRRVNSPTVDASTNNYEVLVECDTEGVISTATTYVRDKNVLIIDDRMATFKNDKLVIVFKDAQKIYNQDFTSVIGTKNLKLVYTKL